MNKPIRQHGDGTCRDLEELFEAKRKFAESPSIEIPEHYVDLTLAQKLSQAYQNYYANQRAKATRMHL